MPLPGLPEGVRQQGDPSMCARCAPGASAGAARATASSEDTSSASSAKGGSSWLYRYCVLSRARGPAAVRSASWEQFQVLIYSLMKWPSDISGTSHASMVPAAPPLSLSRVLDNALDIECQPGARRLTCAALDLRALFCGP